MDTNGYNIGDLKSRLDEKVKDRDDSRQKIVFLVEDEAIQRVLSELMLKKNGYEVISCVNGLDAVEKYKEMYETGKVPYAILMDLEMPEKDGFEATRDILRINRQKQWPKEGLGYFFKENVDPISVPIIAYTTLEEKDIQAKLRVCGFSGYMYKPADEKEFISVLNSYAN